MACSVVARYRIKLSPASGLDRIGGVDMCFFIAYNAASHSSVHSNFLFPRSKLKKGTNLSVDFEMNLLSAAILPVRLCTSLCFLGEGMSISALILSGLASMPRALTINPKNFPEDTPKEHLRV